MLGIKYEKILVFYKKFNLQIYIICLIKTSREISFIFFSRD